MNIQRILIALILMISVPFAASAETGAVDFYHYAGKFYGVVAVIGVIFIGFISFLIWTDLKISRLEKMAKDWTDLNVSQMEKAQNEKNA